MENKRVIVEFSGINRQASDTAVPDGVCAESVNVVIDNNEVMPMVAPQQVLVDVPTDLDYDLLYIHKTSNYTNYIGKVGNKLMKVDGSTNGTTQGFVTLFPYEVVISIKAIGNTLIVSTSGRMLYVLYIDGAYKLLGEQIPEAKVDFTQENVGRGVQISLSMEDIIKEINPLFSLGYNTEFDVLLKAQSISQVYYPSDAGFMSLNDDMKKVNTAIQMAADRVWGELSVHYRGLIGENLLCQPVFVRYAVRLFDGTYTRHSIPILIDVTNFTEDRIFDYMEYARTGSSSFGRLALTNNDMSTFTTPACKLFAQIMNKEELLQWKDIIMGVDFFFTEPIYKSRFGSHIINVENIRNDASNYNFAAKYNIKHYTDKEYEDELVNKSSLFYQVKRIDITDVTDEKVQFEEFKDVFGDALAVQPRLEDGYQSNHKIRGRNIYELNQRLNMSDVSVYLYDCPYNLGSKANKLEENDSYKGGYEFRFFLKTQNGDLITYGKQYIEHSIDTEDVCLGQLGSWISYPDSRCYKVEIYRLGKTPNTQAPDADRYVVTRKMKPHPFLNVSYHFEGMILNDYMLQGTITTDIPSMELIKDMEFMGNKLYQSEVSNPFLFKASGIHTLPVNTILGIASVTTPISQGQFGQYALYVFTDDGIWAMSTNTEGKYQSLAPFSRDICNNPNSITQLEGQVLFTTDRGLMSLDGGAVNCISDNMRGKTLKLDSTHSLPYLEEVMAREGTFLPSDVHESMSFTDYLKGCFISYDYANGRIIVTNPNVKYQYVYIIDTKSWHKMFFDLSFKRTINSYPECFMQSTDGSLYNFSIIDDIESYKEKTTGLIITRAMSLGESFIRKRIDDLRVRGDYDKGSVYRMLFGSYDAEHWTFVNSLKGKSFMYYKIAIIAKLLPKQRVSGVEMRYSTRWDNKMR